jgi:hypothetical protein
MSSFFLHETIYRDMLPAADQRVTICGVGALGANLTETLARMGMRNLRVIDRDRVEAHNLSTQPWTQQDVGAPKARVLAHALYRAVGARVEPQHVELTAVNAAKLLAGSAVVVDAFDNVASRQAVAEAANTLGVPCLHIALAATGDYGCGLWDGAYTSTADERRLAKEGGEQPASIVRDCDYPLTRPLALLVANAASEVLVRYLLDGSTQGFEVTLRDLRLSAVA